MIVLRQFRKRNWLFILILQNQGTTVVGRTGRNRIAIHIVVFVRLVQGKGNTGNCITELVHLDDAADRDFHQVGFQLQVGVTAATFHIEEVQCVVGIAGKRIALQFNTGHCFTVLFGPHLRLFHHISDSCIRIAGITILITILSTALNGNFACSKVNGQFQAVMHTAHIADQYTVDEHPDIVIA